MTNPQNSTTQTHPSASNPHSPCPKWLRSEGEHTLHEGETEISNSIRGSRPSPKVKSNLGISLRPAYRFPHSYRSHSRLEKTYPGICGTSRDSKNWRRSAVFGGGIKWVNKKSSNFRTSSYSGQIRTYAGSLESWKWGEFNCDISEGNGSLLWGVKMEWMIEEGFYDGKPISEVWIFSWGVG